MPRLRRQDDQPHFRLGRRPLPDYTQRATKLRLFTCVTLVMLVLTLMERACDPGAWKWLWPPAQSAASQQQPNNRPPDQPQRTDHDALSTAIDTPPLDSEPIVDPPAGPREILERYEIGESQLQSFMSGQPITPGEENLLVKILYCLPRIGLDQLQRWRTTSMTWDQLAAAPTDHRAAVFALRGRVKRVTTLDLRPQQADLFEFTHYYRVTLDLDQSPYQSLVLAREIPSAWQLDVPLDERAAADALFLKLDDFMAPIPQLIFVAGRVAWLPDRTDPEHHVGPSLIALANLGMDAGLWDSVRGANRSPLGDIDREAFYQLLAALGRPEASQLQAAPAGRLDIVRLLEQPAEHQGDVLPVEATVRRIRKVPVSDVDVQSRFGLDHYYELDVLLPLDNTSLRFGGDPTGEQNPVYHNHFPATLIVRQLPPDLAEGENLHQTIHANAVFFKIWTYRSGYADRIAQVQLAPLLIASQPRAMQNEMPVNWVVGIIVGSTFAAALGLFVFVLWSSRRADRAYAAARKRDFGTGETKPDFSKFVQ